MDGFMAVRRNYMSVLKTPENALLILTNYGKLSNKSGSPCNAVRRLHKRLIKTITPSGALIMRIRAWQPRAYDYQINVHDLCYSRQSFRPPIKQTLLTLRHLVNYVYNSFMTTYMAVNYWTTRD
ncbi:hypothetical protein T4E_9920 [Trichinella pseudospiralis]|uniref:Uncharacterized protein n=1 Tax=Trichinella pseudospiralis TaxID=6337 RepID=A0A0V0XFT0_TRIPS|nr:hypothetical protein T4E_5504 [Trichinella pseudospiralis]KRX86677.1 hypothetical protein T4E_9920 [Trichinella pseudospiralis]